MAVTASYSYQDSYQDQTSKTMCPESLGSKPVTCQTGSFGAPALQVKSLIAIEAKWIFATNPNWIVPQVGIDPKFTYDTHARQYGVDVPIYVLSNGSKGLTGGIDVGWSNTAHATVGLFLNQPLQVGLN